MGLTLYWRIAVIAAVLAGAWFVYDLIGDNREFVRGMEAQTRAIKTLTERAARVERALAENQTFDDDTRGQATNGVSRNESTRRTDREVIAIDKPWPAAMRGRVFDNPDPASGSTAAAGAPAGGEGRE